MRMGKIEELYQDWQSLQPIKEEYSIGFHNLKWLDKSKVVG